MDCALVAEGELTLGEGGLIVSDVSSSYLDVGSRPLSIMTQVRPFAHIEHAKGHIVFDIGEGEPTRQSLSVASHLTFR